MREADIGPFETSNHRIHHAPLPRPVVGPERRAVIHVHWYTALANDYGSLAKRAIASFHEIADLGGGTITCSRLSPVESIEIVRALLVAYHISVAKAGATLRTREIA